MKRKSKGKKILISLVCLVLVAAIGLGIWHYTGTASAEPVNVYPFEYIGMTEYWGDSQESYGMVQTDKIQTVYLSNTQSVTEILVQVGDAVKKGDVLLTFDTTLSDLSLERKRLDVEKLKLQLENAKKQLNKINAMKPMVIPKPSEKPDKEEDLGTELTEAFLISTNPDYDGSTKDKAIICWIKGNTAIEDEVLDALIQAAEEYQTINAIKEAEKEQEKKSSSASAISTEPSSEPTVPPSSEPTVPPTEEPTVPPTEEPTVPPTEEPTVPPTEEPTAPPTEEPTVPPSSEPTVPPTEEPTVPPTEEPTAPPTEEPTVPPTEEPTAPPTEEPTVPPTEEPTEPSEPEIEVEVNKFFVVFKVTQDNKSLGARKIWQGFQVNRNKKTGEYKLRFFDASMVPDHMLAPDEEAEEAPQIDYGSGFTASQIAQMRSEQEKTIRDLEFNIKMAEAEYKIMQTEVSDGKIYAQVDGTVVSLISEDEAQMTQQPLIKVSGGGGFFVEGAVSELEKDNMEIGQEVTINDWNTGMVYTGTIQSMGDYPSTDNSWSGMGNPNSTYYPFTVFVDETADLQSGRYVSIVYSAGTSEHGVYLQNPFLRTEGGRSYVYVQGADGMLEQRFVTTGKSLWGSYMEILDGLSAEDLIAFPYGKDVKAGAPTVEADISELYE